MWDYGTFAFELQDKSWENQEKTFYSYSKYLSRDYVKIFKSPLENFQMVSTLYWYSEIQIFLACGQIFESVIQLVQEKSKNINIAQCIANSICKVARKLELHWTSQILNEKQD